jgi:NAD+ diphosphatase
MRASQSPPYFYAGNQFNRLAERRDDEAWLREQLRHADTQWLLSSQGRHLVQLTDPPTLALLPTAALENAWQQHEWILLGEFRGRLHFALNVPDLAASNLGALPAGSELHDLRQVGALMEREEAGLLGYARALSLWHDRHRFCGQCGSATRSIKAGHARQCSNAACGLQHFPRLDPAIIVLITDGKRVLLGRQARWPSQRYSTIAGFVEWGESLEEAVAREVHEETGVRIDEVRYHSSQPWPFPSSLMLGFIAHAATTEITRHDGELEDARWLSRDELRNGVVVLPPVHAISFALIESWYNQDTLRALRDEPGVRIAGVAPG